ncbi:MAG TPA: DUF2934 domain-containing protein [Gemmatimonadales bacterium]|nr:DUF2934 domain-containing protein [Gemmatimonadales bacterium]
MAQFQEHESANDGTQTPGTPNDRSFHSQLPDQPERNIREDEIRRRAYELYESRGGTDGSEMDDWLAAEREIELKDLAFTDEYPVDDQSSAYSGGMKASDSETEIAPSKEPSSRKTSSRTGAAESARAAPRKTNSRRAHPRNSDGTSL